MQIINFFVVKRLLLWLLLLSGPFHPLLFGCRSLTGHPTNVYRRARCIRTRCTVSLSLTNMQGRTGRQNEEMSKTAFQSNVNKWLVVHSPHQDLNRHRQYNGKITISHQLVEWLASLSECSHSMSTIYHTGSLNR